MNGQPASIEQLTQRVHEKARSLGFDAVGIARADVPLDDDIAHYRAFVDAGMQGDMTWLAENAEARERLDGDSILPGARSVICVGKSYRRRGEDDDPAIARTVARYARGRDYHGGLRKKIRKLAAFVRTLESGATARPMCDTAPVLERAWAARAGLGFVGKNGLLIVPGKGSFLLLGEVVTSVVLEPARPMEGRCGSCTRCLDVCPTGAFTRPFVLDARRCVAYLTIEHRGEIDPTLREGVGEHLFGCDRCQEVCPFNATPPRADPPPFEPLARWGESTLLDLLALDDGGFEVLARGSPLFRAGREGLARNAVTVLGNRGDPANLPVLERTARSHPSAVVREAAAWAVARVRATKPA